MIRWQYKTESFFGHVSTLGEILAQRGDDGWELVSMCALPKSGDPAKTTWVAFFKRQGEAG